MTATTPLAAGFATIGQGAGPMMVTWKAGLFAKHGLDITRPRLMLRRQAVDIALIVVEDDDDVAPGLWRRPGLAHQSQPCRGKNGGNRNRDRDSSHVILPKRHVTRGSPGTKQGPRTNPWRSRQGPPRATTVPWNGDFLWRPVPDDNAWLSRHLERITQSVGWTGS